MRNRVLAEAMAMARGLVTDTRTSRERNRDSAALMAEDVSVGVVAQTIPLQRPCATLSLDFVDPAAAAALARQAAAEERVRVAEQKLRDARWDADFAARRLERERTYADRLAMLRELRAIVLAGVQQGVLDAAIADLEAFYAAERENDE